MFENINWIFEVMDCSPALFWLFVGGVCVYAYMWKPVYKTKKERINADGTKEKTEETTIYKHGGLD